MAGKDVVIGLTLEEIRKKIGKEEKPKAQKPKSKKQACKELKHIV